MGGLEDFVYIKSLSLDCTIPIFRPSYRLDLQPSFIASCHPFFCLN